MKKRKILIVCRSFYPEISPRSFRATELAKEFARQGHEVTVLTHFRDFDYSEFIKSYNLQIKYFSPNTLKNLSIPFLKKVSHKINRMLYMLFHYPDIEIAWHLKKKLKHEKGFDLMISVAVPYPVHWGTAWARTKNNRIANIWIADCGDPFMGNKLESFKFPFYFKYIEKYTFRKCDYITIPVEDAISGYYKEFHYKIKVIPQGFDFNEIKTINKTSHEIMPVFAYAGGISKNGIRSPLKLIQYLNSLDRDFKFHIYATAGKEIVAQLATESSGRIIIHDALPRAELLPELANMDFLVNFDNGNKTQMPSKLIDYAITGVPILNINPENPDISLINEFLNGNYINSLKIKNIEQFKIDNVCKLLLNLLNE